MSPNLFQGTDSVLVVFVGAEGQAAKSKAISSASPLDWGKQGRGSTLFRALEILEWPGTKNNASRWSRDGREGKSAEKEQLHFRLIQSRCEMGVAEVTLRTGLSDLVNKNAGCPVKFEFQIKDIIFLVCPEYCMGHAYAKNYSLLIWNSRLTGRIIFLFKNLAILMWLNLFFFGASPRRSKDSNLRAGAPLPLAPSQWPWVGFSGKGSIPTVRSSPEL